MAYTTSFDGAADTLLSSLSGWSLSTGYYDVLRLNGSGALKHDVYTDDGKTVLNPVGTASHYVKAIVGAGFVGAAGGIGMMVCASDRGDNYYLAQNGSNILFIGANGSSVRTSIPGQTAVAGDELELAWDAVAKELTVRKNGTLIATEPIPGNTKTGTATGITLSYSGRAATDDIFRSWESGTIGGSSDTEPPVLPDPITIGAKTSSSITVTGPAGTDNVGITAREFSVDGGTTYPYTSATLPYTITGLTELTSYPLRYRAKDAAGNISNVLSLTTSTYRAGALGSTILLTTGPVDGNPAGILYNDVATDGSDDNKWFSFRIIEQNLNGGTLDIDPDGTLTFTGAASGSFTYQLEVDGVDVGSPQLVTLYDQTTYRPSGDVTTTGWTSTGANFYDQINESPSNDASYVTSPPLSTMTDPLTLDIASMSAGNYIAKFRARKTQTTGEVRMVFLGAGGASVGETAWQPVTTSFALYELPVTLTATSARVRLDVRE